MADFYSKRAPSWWRVHVGDCVTGEANGKSYTGVALESDKKRGKPAIYRVRSGAVLLKIALPGGKQKSICELRPA
jgi:hypothetical protein